MGQRNRGVDAAQIGSLADRYLSVCRSLSRDRAERPAVVAALLRWHRRFALIPFDQLMTEQDNLRFAERIEGMLRWAEHGRLHATRPVAASSGLQAHRR